MASPEIHRNDCGRTETKVANAAPWSFALKELYLANFPEDSLWEVYGSTELGVDTGLVGGLVGGCVSGALSGAALVWLLHEPPLRAGEGAGT